MASLLDIGIITEKKAQRQKVSCAKLRKDGGLVGDFHVDDKERAISIIGTETIETLNREGIKGLCTSKFSANLITQGIALDKLSPNARIKIGDVELKITQVGKECFAICGMDDRSKCPLKLECAFGIALSDGIITVGCEINVIS